VSVDKVNTSFDQHRRAIDPLYNAQRRLAEGQTMWRDALARGAVTQAEYSRGVRLLNKEFAGATTSLSTLTAGMGPFTALAAAYKAVQFGRDVFDTALAFERGDKTLLAATGSLAAAKAEMSFVRVEAQRLGLDLLQTATDYAKLAAATRGTALEGEATRE